MPGSGPNGVLGTLALRAFPFHHFDPLPGFARLTSLVPAVSFLERSLFHEPRPPRFHAAS